MILSSAHAAQVASAFPDSKPKGNPKGHGQPWKPMRCSEAPGQKAHGNLHHGGNGVQMWVRLKVRFV